MGWMPQQPPVSSETSRNWCNAVEESTVPGRSGSDVASDLLGDFDSRASGKVLSVMTHTRYTRDGAYRSDKLSRRRHSRADLTPGEPGECNPRRDRFVTPSVERGVWRAGDTECVG